MKINLGINDLWISLLGLRWTINTDNVNGNANNMLLFSRRFKKSIFLEKYFYFYKHIQV